jgi:hypothetical protein
VAGGRIGERYGKDGKTKKAAAFLCAAAFLIGEAGY